MVEKVRAYIEKNNMIPRGAHICAGISGGPDSTALVEVLHILEQELEFTLSAVHVNHCLRGEESDLDEQFVRSFCALRQIPLDVYRCDVAGFAASRHIGTEEAGRKLRREAFARSLKKRGGTAAALAHHANDQAETVLFNLARGSSLKGCAGIRPVSGPVIHPFLCMSRAEIEAWLSARDIVCRLDSSNRTDDYTRNRLRRQVIPALEENVNSAAVRHIAQAAEDIAEADLFLAQEARKRETDLLFLDAVPGTESGRRIPPGCVLMIREEICLEAPVLQRYVLMDAMELVCGRRKDLGREQLRQILALFAGQTGRRADLPGGMTARREYNGVSLVLQENGAETAREEEALFLHIPENGETLEIPYGGQTFSMRLFSAGDHIREKEIPRNRYTKWLDYDKIKDGLQLRFRRPGDYLAVTAEGGTKKLKDLLINEKIPAAERDGIVLLAAGSEVYWAVGCRLSEACRITEQTERVLEIRTDRGGT